MEILTKTLKEALNKVKPGLSNKEMIEQSTSFVFQRGHVYTYNDEIAISHPLKIRVLGAVRARELLDFVNRIKDEKIEIIMNEDKTELLLLKKFSTATFTLNQELILPINDIEIPDTWIDVPEAFCEAIKFCIFSVSTNPSEPVLQCLHVHGQYVESTDTMRITQYNMGTKAKKCFPKSILIPANAAKHLPGINPIKYNTTQGWVHFQNEKKLTYSCRIVDEEYVNITPHLKIDEDQSVSIDFPKKIIGSIENASVFTQGNLDIENVVNIRLCKNQLTITGQGISGKYVEKIKIKWDEEEISFDNHPKNLLDILKIVQSTIISKKEDHSKLKFIGENFEHIVCTERTDN